MPDFFFAALEAFNFADNFALAAGLIPFVFAAGLAEAVARRLDARGDGGLEAAVQDCAVQARRQAEPAIVCVHDKPNAEARAKVDGSPLLSAAGLRPRSREKGGE